MEQPKRKRKTKEQHTKDVQLAKKRKVFQNAKVIQKYRKLQEQEDKQGKEKPSAARSSIYDQVFANTDSASTRLVGNLKGRDKKYQAKQTGRDARKKTQASTQRPNPYNKVVHQKNKEERLTQEQLDMKRKKRHQNAQSRKRDNKKLKGVQRHSSDES